MPRTIEPMIAVLFAGLVSAQAVNRQTGQWGTEYRRARDLGTVAMKSDTVHPPVEKFTIAIESSDTRHGTLVMAWGTFRWTAPFVVQ